MKCSSFLQELTNWAIDRPGVGLPERLESHLNECPRCRAEWEALRGWAEWLRPAEEPWKPDEGFFEQLTDQAMREKRRANLTDATRRDLALDSSGWFSLFQQPLYRWLPTVAVFLLLALPLIYGWHRMYTTIGEFNFSAGQVLAQADRPLDSREGMALKRNTSVQTPPDAESIVRLESGAEVCVASLSRVTFLDSQTVKVDHGKAYFDIPKQKSGFIVQLPQGEVEVLGTAFEIAVIQGQTTVTVTRGIVRVTNENHSVRVEQGMESQVDLRRQPTAPRQARRINQVVNWVAQIQAKRNQDELRKFYPSLAAPTPKEVKP